MTESLGRHVFLVFGLILLFFYAIEGHTDDQPVYPHATVVESLEENRSNHPVITSAMKKVNGVVKADAEQWLEGGLSRKLYLLPGGQSSFAAYDFYTDFFQSIGIKEVFSCQRFRCGESNYWANNVFKIAKLYGLDKEQNYFVGEKSNGQQKTYYSVYTVKRGNGRVYALVDAFTPAITHDSESLSAQIKRTGYVYLPVENKVQFIADIKNILSNHNQSEVVLSYFIPKVSSLKSFVNEQKEAASKMTALREKLVQEGVSKQQFRLIFSGIDPDLSSQDKVKVIPISNVN